ncbi:RICIN domain-containing protein [Streptomyces griseorubiginosus]|uniref:RICIN domain-containing protein n=1 Tax=Streptomyces griseorubiginosus TaxID=67304 RepID=UPI0033E5B4E4
MPSVWASVSKSRRGRGASRRATQRPAPSPPRSTAPPSPRSPPTATAVARSVSAPPTTQPCSTPTCPSPRYRGRPVRHVRDRQRQERQGAGRVRGRHRPAGYYTITGIGNGKALDIPFATTWPGIQLQLWTPTGNPNQQWQIAPTDNGSHMIESRLDGYRLDVWNNSTTDGGLIDAWPAGGTANQQWTLVKLS